MPKKKNIGEAMDESHVDSAVGPGDASTEAPFGQPEEHEESSVVIPESLGTLGRANLPISYLGMKSLNGREYHEVHCQDGTEYLLNEEEFKDQVNP